ncbi:MAG TPA: PQQ-binding-like beta-propeller repeat protein [Gemmataceae bacterium]|jgi:outer membrane protein assembly factor BamB|nr:PQQ-binding-like beta-propeller repeat protein [Gemmataceae bacterium]
MKPLCSLATGLLVAASACAQPERPADNATAARIADGVQKARDLKLLDAVEQFQRVLDTAGDDLVPVDRSQHTLARWVVHGYLASLGPEGVKLYRQRVDGQAAKRLEEAKKSRDDAGLHRLLADMFTAKATEEAVLELARRAFERADFDGAEHYWRMLLPATKDDDRLLHFPDPTTSPAAVQARLMLVKLFRGERDEAKEELKGLREKWANQTGLLAGKTGKYVDTLTELINNPAQTTLPRVPDAPDWPTFAGSPQRLGTNRAKLPYFWPDVPTWKTPLPFLRSNRIDTTPADPLHPYALAFYPMVTGGRAYVGDGARVFAIELMTGKIATAAWPDDGADAVIPTRQDVRFTLTESDGILYARLGASALKAVDGPKGKSFISAFGPRKDDTEERPALWRLDPPAAEGAVTHFEGAPSIRNGRVYAAFWRQAGAESTAGIACYRIDDPKIAPELVWQRIVGKAGSEPNGETRYRHSLVTLSGPNVVYCTDGGTVIALDAISGKPQWEYRYPRNERAIMPRYHDLCPPLADGGRIYAAPADTDRLLCIDAFTGHLIWEREGVEVIHLLGVARGRLIATFGGSDRGIRGLNLRTGADSGPNGWTIHDDGGETTFGRGLVTEEAVVWPTRHGLHFIDPSDGTPLRSPIRGPTAEFARDVTLPNARPSPFGNLCYADGVLLVTTATEVWGYVSEAKKLGDRRKAVGDDPNNPAKHADLTQSLIDAGLYVEAEAEAAKAGDAKDRLRWLLAEKMIRDGEKAGATRFYEELAKGKGSFAAAGKVRLAEVYLDRPKVLTAWNAVLSNRSTIRNAHGVPWPADIYGYTHGPSEVQPSWGGVGSKAEEDLASLFPSRKAQSPALGYVSKLEKTNCDPTIRIVNARHGFFAVGEEVNHFGRGGSAFAGPRGLSYWSSRDDKFHPILDYRADGPIVNDRSRVGSPAASSVDGPEQLEHYDIRTESVGFMYDRRTIAFFQPNLGYVEIRSLSPWSTATLHPKYALTGRVDLAQTTDGRMLVWNSSRDEPRQFRCTSKPWSQAPQQLDSDKFLIPDDGSVLLFDAEAGKELARYIVPGAASLTGELPRFRIHEGDALLLIDRNHGVEADRLRISNLQRAWSQEAVFVGRHLDDIAFAGTRFFTAADGMLVARSWKAGKQLWETPLPDVPNTKWKLAVSPQGLLVYPAEALLRHPDFDAVGEFGRAGWNKAALLRAMSRTYDVWADRELPILVIDPEDGRLAQRLSFLAAGPAAGVAVTAKGVVVVTGKGSWTLTGR